MKYEEKEFEHSKKLIFDNLNESEFEKAAQKITEENPELEGYINIFIKYPTETQGEKIYSKTFHNIQDLYESGYLGYLAEFTQDMFFVDMESNENGDYGYTGGTISIGLTAVF